MDFKSKMISGAAAVALIVATAGAAGDTGSSSMRRQRIHSDRER